MFVRRAGSIALFAVLATSCARNAGIEIELIVPPAPAGTHLFAYVQFERPPLDFDSQWPDTTDVAGMPLGSVAQPLHFSVLTESFDAPLLIKVRFCETERCRGSAPAPELWFQLEHPFYRAQRTSWTHVITEIPTVNGVSCGQAASIGRCEIQGCVSVSSQADRLNFCRLDGTHFCEVPTDGVGPDSGPPFDACAPGRDAGSRDAGNTRDAGDAARGGG